MSHFANAERRLSPRLARLGAAIALSSIVGTAYINDAYAGAVIFNSADPSAQTVALGVNDQGHLNVDFNNDGALINIATNASATGLALNFGDAVNRDFRDATAPGCLCEGWGLAVTTASGRISGYASVDNGGIGGLTGGTFGATTTSATSTVRLLDANVMITHSYGVSLAPNTFQGNITITNNTGGTLNDVVYRRAMDWDVPNTEFSEYVTHSGITSNLIGNGGNLLYASDDGFAFVDPLSGPSFINAETVNTDFTDNGPTDHGSLFDFAFGSLAAGESRTFNIFYGAFTSELDALAAIAILRPNLYSLGQSNPNGDEYTGGGGEGGGGDEGCEVDCSFDSGPGISGPGNSVGNPTFLFAFGGVGGVAPGSSADNPVLPFVPAPGQYFFENPAPRLWYDPPFAFGFDYELIGGGEFLSVMTPTGVGPLTLRIGSLDFTIAEMTEFFFGPGVTQFSIFGLTADFDAGTLDPLPTFLDFTAGSTGLLMTAIFTDPNVQPPTSVPAPPALVLLLIGLVAVAMRRRAS